MVYWKGSNVSLSEKDSEGKEKKRILYGVLDGQVIVLSGTWLYITAGKVKEV
jgi:hypothetical protein